MNFTYYRKSMNPLNINFPWKRHSFYATWSPPFKILLNILVRKEAGKKGGKHTSYPQIQTHTATHFSHWQTEIHCSTMSQFLHFSTKDSCDLLCPTSNNTLLRTEEKRLFREWIMPSLHRGERYGIYKQWAPLPKDRNYFYLLALLLFLYCILSLLHPQGCTQYSIKHGRKKVTQYPPNSPHATSHVQVRMFLKHLEASPSWQTGWVRSE